MQAEINGACSSVDRFFVHRLKRENDAKKTETFQHLESSICQESRFANLYHGMVPEMFHLPPFSIGIVQHARLNARKRAAFFSFSARRLPTLAYKSG